MDLVDVIVIGVTVCYIVLTIKFTLFEGKEDKTVEPRDE